MMPKLWNETIETHRNAVRAAILDTAGALVARQGLSSVTMSEIAQGAGIGRATLYKYFPDVDAILAAWHERQVNAHVAYLVQVRDRLLEPFERLQGVLEAYALMSRGGHGPHGEAAATAHLQARLHAQLHEGAHVVDARRQLRELFRDLLDEAARAGDIRNDVAPEELAGYCLHALAAAGTLTSKDAVRRLVAVTLPGLRPPAVT